MNSGVSRQVQDERDRAWDIAREAARRSGMSVDQWLDTVKSGSSADGRADPARRTGATEDSRHPFEASSQAPRPRYSEYDARHRRGPAEDPMATTPLDQALFEIAERQHALDGELSRADRPRAQTQGFPSLEQELRRISQQVETIRPCALDHAVEILRDDLAEIGAMVKDAMPRQAVEALESEVRSLADRIDAKRHSGVDAQALAGLEQGLAEVRDVLRTLRPAENLVGLDEAVQGLTQRIERVASSSDQEPATLQQLESAIVGLRAIVSHVASNEALAKLSDEVHGLAGKVDQVTSSDILSTLGQRIDIIADALHSRHQQNGQEARDIDAVVNELTGKVDRLQLTRGDHTAVVSLEDRIAKLVEKLDASDARLSHLEVIERGLAELLIHIEQQRVPSMTGGGASMPEVDTLKRDIQRNQEALEGMHGTLSHLVDRLAMIEIDVRGGPPPASGMPMAIPAVAARSSGAAASAAKTTAVAPLPMPQESTPVAASGNPAPATAQDRRPIDPNLPPDHPLEPGSSSARGRSAASPADRIAASEAAVDPAKPPVIPDPAGKLNFIAAARRAAQAASREAASPTDNSAIGSDESNAAASKTGGLSKRIRSLLAGTGVVLLVLGSLQIAAHRFLPSDDLEGSAPDLATESTASNVAIPSDMTAATEPAPQTSPAAGRQSMLFPGTDSTPFTALPPGIMLPAEPTRPATNAAAPKSSRSTDVVDRTVTGSIQPPVSNPFATPGTAPLSLQPQSSARPSEADKLPPALGSTGLRAAAVKGDPAAEFEVALRFADGRGVPQDLTAAAEWFERAAKQGLVPAQFRLGGLYEKGMGVKKNLESARRLYLGAAEAGNAKAMHNLAVLFAEGIEGKPDYQNAAKWFRKAADHGVGDSQYNLGILYARGIGVEVNMAEAYKWFTLAARGGDNDAAKKRDDVGSRLDQQSLMAARAGAQVWTAQTQPDAAFQVNAPAGGWDNVATATTPKRRIGVRPEVTAPRPAQ